MEIRYAVMRKEELFAEPIPCFRYKKKAQEYIDKLPRTIRSNYYISKLQ